MKHIKFNWVIFLLLLLPNICNAQDLHEQLENFFSSHSLRTFEIDLGLLPDDYKYLNRIDEINETYDEFFESVHDRLTHGISPSISDLQSEYDALIISTQADIKHISNQSFPLSSKVPGGPCINMDFETGDISGWDLTRGNVDGSAPYSFANEFAVGPGQYHQILGGGVDPVTGIPQVNPLNGNFSVRLGNGVGVGARAARMKQTFLVDANNYMFTYSYAVVFESPAGHTLNELPYFSVRVLDEFGNSAPCGDYFVIADALNAPTFQTIVSGGVTVLYQDWQTVFTNLSGYIGQNVTIEFTSGDCSLSGHYGYAYVDAACSMSDIIATQYTICTGESTVLTAPVGAASYLWSNGATSQSISVTAGGTYSCTLMPSQGGACSIVLDIIVDEYVSPTADFSSITEICAGESVVFTDLSTIPAPGSIVNYCWDFDDGIITPESNGAIVGVTQTTGNYQLPTHTFMTAGVHNVELWVQSADGCVDSISIPVTVNPTPVVVAGVDQIVCEGISVTLNGSGATSYAWDNGILNGVSFVQPVGTITYNVIGTNAYGCFASDQVDVTVNPLPIVNAGLDQAVCDDIPITLFSTGSPNLNWNNGVINNVPFNQGVGTVTYTVFDSFATGCSASDEVIVTVNPNPIVNAYDFEVCAGDGVTLSGEGAVSYSWSDGVVNGIEFFPTQSATYTVIGTNIFGCYSNADATVTVFDLPVADFNILDMALTTITPGTGFDNLSTGAVSYEWIFGDDSGISNEFEPYHEFPTSHPGTYEIILTAFSSDGCIDTRVKYVYLKPDYTIYVPNTFTPDGNGVNEYFKPVLEGFDKSDYTLYIFNRWGELVFESHDMDVGWDGKYSQLNEGVQDGVFTWKIEASVEHSSDSKTFLGHISILK